MDITTQNNPGLKIMGDYGYANERSQREETLRTWEKCGQDISGKNTFDFNIYYNQYKEKYKLRIKNGKYMDLSIENLEQIYDARGEMGRVYKPAYIV